MKRKLTKVEFETLHAELQKMYKAEGDIYVLQLAHDPDNDPAELRRARDREKITADSEKARADKAEADLAKINTTTARSSGDIDALEKSWQQKLDKQKADADALIAKKDKFIREALVESKATAMAIELAGDNAELLKPHILARLQADNLDSDSPTTRVLDTAGKPSALSLEDLQKEFVANKKFSAIIIASKASGGATGKQNVSANGGAGRSSEKKFSELSEAERIDWYKRDPAGFTEASEAAQRKF